MDENFQSRELFNFCQDMDRAELERIVNALIGPIVLETELFCDRQLSSEFAAQRFLFWARWLEGVQNALMLPEVMSTLRCPNPNKERLYNAFEALSDEDAEVCSSLIQKSNELSNQFAEKQSQIEYRSKEFSDQYLEIEENHLQRIEGILSSEGHVGGECAWEEYTPQIQAKILESYSKKNEMLEKLKNTQDDTEYKAQFNDESEKLSHANMEIHARLSEYIGEENADVALGMGMEHLFNDLFLHGRLRRGIELLHMELMKICYGEQSESIKSLFKRYRGNRKDSFAVRQLKDQIGVVYRALRYVKADSMQAVDTINYVLKKHGLRINMTKDAIIKRAPKNLLEFSPWEIIHRDNPVIKDKDLVREEGESIEECYVRHANLWLEPFILSVKNFSGIK